MKNENNSKLLPYAKQLRRDMTPHERKLWYLFLRKYPAKIYKQKIIGHYIVDFYCPAASLVIELDGSQHYEVSGQNTDAERDAFLRQSNLRVLRFSNREIDREFTQVCEAIDYAIRGTRD